MAGPRVIPKGFSFWPQAAQPYGVEDLIKAYSSGLAGAYAEPEEREALIAENRALTGFGSIDEAATANGWADSGQGKLIVPFVHVLEAYPGCWPGPAQGRGSCVVHNQKNAGLGSMVCEVVAGKPDEQTGKTERFPEVPQEGIKNGVLSTEAIYWWRRHSGDGWSCSAACRVTQKESGLWLRQSYDELGIDLTRYDAQLEGRYGANPPTGVIAQAGLKNLARAYAESRSREARRDALANGYFGSTCGMESYGRTRDQHGVSRRTREGWAHAMASIAFDDRASTKEIYGDSLELILNSWAVWNSGPRDIRDSAAMVPPSKRAIWKQLGITNAVTGNIMIPEGSMWVLSSECKDRDWFAISSINGWPRKNLLDWGGSLAG